MDFLQNRIRAAEAAGRNGDGDAVRRILDHAVAEDPTAIDRLKAAVDRLSGEPR